MRTRTLFTAFAVFLATGAWGQSPQRKAVILRAAHMYVSPDANSQVVGEAQPGQDAAVEESNGIFDHVFLVESGAAGISGWIPKGGVVFQDQPDGPEVLFGAAVELESQAESASGQRTAATNAGRIYYRIWEEFSASPRAAEALFRAADINWQLGMRDVNSHGDSSMRQLPNDDLLHRVISKYPDSPWAARAAFDLLDQHLNCGDWNEKPDCPGKQISVYDDYAKKYPRSPKVPEALYDIAYRAAVSWTTYSRNGAHHDDGKAQNFKKKLDATAEQLRTQYPDTDWTARAALLAYTVELGSPVYANNGE